MIRLIADIKSHGEPAWSRAQELFGRIRSTEGEKFRILFNPHYNCRISFAGLLDQTIQWEGAVVCITEINIFSNDAVYATFAAAWHTLFPNESPFAASGMVLEAPTDDDLEFISTLLTIASVLGFDISVYSPLDDLAVVCSHDDWVLALNGDERAYPKMLSIMDAISEQNRKFGPLEKRSVFVRIFGRFKSN